MLRLRLPVRGREENRSLMEVQHHLQTCPASAFDECVESLPGFLGEGNLSLPFDEGHIGRKKLNPYMVRTPRAENLQILNGKPKANVGSPMNDVVP
jgi:hypothetical protein